MPSTTLLSFLTLSLLLSACGTVKLKDGEVCGDMGSLGATCDHTFTSKPRDLSKAEWDAFRVGQLCMNSSLFANWKASLIKFCNDTKRCTYEEEKAIERVGKKLDELSQKTQLINELSEKGSTMEGE